MFIRASYIVGATLLLQCAMAHIALKGWSIGANVSAEDLRIGSQLKTYVYQLPRKFHQEEIKRYDRGCLLSACPARHPLVTEHHYTDYSAEIIILAKLLKALHIVENPGDADIFLVPALLVTVGNDRCMFSFLSCAHEWHKELFQHLTYLDAAPLRPHIFLASQDFKNNHQLIRDLKPNHPNAIIINYGPGGLVMPSLNSDVELQSSHDRQDIFNRSVFIMANYGIRFEDRTAVTQALHRYKGNLTLVKPLDGQDEAMTSQRFRRMERKMDNAVFTLCLAGDLPFQKRFFDAILHMSLPVVIERPFIVGNRTSSTYWKKTYQFDPLSMNDFSVETSYPGEYI